MAESIHDETVLVLEEMLSTFKNRNLTYGENYLALGKVMVAMFPDGIVLKTEEDFIRYHWMDWMLGKLTRFANSGLTHEDSIKDSGVYDAMITAFLRRHPHVGQIERSSGVSKPTQK